MTIFKPKYLVLLAVTSGSSFAATSATALLNRFNVIAGEYNMNGETEGAVFVAGDFNPGGTHQIGFNNGSASIDTDYNLWLNNGLSTSNTTQIQTGSLISRVSVDPTRFLLNGNAPGDPVVTTGEPAWSDTLSAQLGLGSGAEAMSILSDASATWSGFAANSTATIGSGSVNFEAAPVLINGLNYAIFNVGSPDLDGTIGSINLSLNNADAVLINVSGDDVAITKNFTGDFTNNNDKIIFNFYEASNVSLGTNMHGTVFAPNAVVSQTGGSNLDGSVVAATFNQSAEVHNYPYIGPAPAAPAIPEPTSLVLSILGVGSILRRRR